MGINPPSLYAAFGNKEALFRKALDRYAVRRTAFWDEALNAPTARGMVETLLRETAMFLTEECNPPGCLFVRSMVSCGETAEDGSARNWPRAAHRGRGSNLGAPRARKRGRRTAANVSPADFARYIVTVLEGMSVQAAGGATREELLRVADMALRLCPSPRTEAKGTDEGLARQPLPGQVGS